MGVPGRRRELRSGAELHQLIRRARGRFHRAEEGGGLRLNGQPVRNAAQNA